MCWALLALINSAPAQEWADIDKPQRNSVAPRRTEHAVVIGIEHYFRVPTVPYADRDAHAFWNWLVSARGVPTDQALLLTREVNREHLMDALHDVGRRAGHGDTVWVYYAGHGAADPGSGERLLLGDDVSTDVRSFARRGVTMAEAQAAVTAGGASARFIIDACFNGRMRNGAPLTQGERILVPDFATRKPTRDRQSAPFAQAPTVLEWSATGPSGIAQPLDPVQHGAFTYLVVGALRGWADGERDGRSDGIVTADEAELYVQRRLRGLGVDQLPVFDGDRDTALAQHADEAGPGLVAGVLTHGSASPAQTPPAPPVNPSLEMASLPSLDPSGPPRRPLTADKGLTFAGIGLTAVGVTALVVGAGIESGVRSRLESGSETTHSVRSAVSTGNTAYSIGYVSLGLGASAIGIVAIRRSW